MSRVREGRNAEDPGSGYIITFFSPPRAKPIAPDDGDDDTILSSRKRIYETANSRPRGEAAANIYRRIRAPVREILLVARGKWGGLGELSKLSSSEGTRYDLIRFHNSRGYLLSGLEREKRTTSLGESIANSVRPVPDLIGNARAILMRSSWKVPL